MKRRRLVISLTVFGIYVLECSETVIQVLQLKYTLRLGFLLLHGVGTKNKC